MNAATTTHTAATLHTFASDELLNIWLTGRYPTPVDCAHLARDLARVCSWPAARAAVNAARADIVRVNDSASECDRFINELAS